MSGAVRILGFAFCVFAASQLASAESQEPATAEKEKKQNVAVSSNGYSIELVAIVRMDQKERFAWSPDGSKIDISEKWGTITEVRGQGPSHGLVFRCSGFQKSQNLGWRIGIPGTATPIFRDHVPEFVSISTILKERATTKIRVGILGEWGPWQRVQPDGTPDDPKPVPKEFQPLYQLVKSVEVYHDNNPGRLKCGFILNGVVGNKQVVDLLEYEVAVVDGTGKRHKRTGTGIWKGGPIPYFGLTEDEIAHFEYRIRPYVEWITFENIPLEPGKDSKLKITVEKVDPPKVK